MFWRFDCFQQNPNPSPLRIIYFMLRTKSLLVGDNPVESVTVSPFTVPPPSPLTLPLVTSFVANIVVSRRDPSHPRPPQAVCAPRRDQVVPPPGTCLRRPVHWIRFTVDPPVTCEAQQPHHNRRPPDPPRNNNTNRDTPSMPTVPPCHPSR
eukprot:TRINITY_DN22809_c0_g1_i1.p1 TRINITY_DN22809_c0_g1~~TRINITY_DN22809_c0_g1_i1.p1  ORF type:complete len:151 (+),score=6.74 TRINITY_DN22809_c0_g1_i1:270-722(+)